MNARAILVATFFALATPSWAGEGHSHGEAAAPANGNGPQRLPDGSVFLPKPAQHQLSVRTTVTKAGELRGTVELAGRVVMDPNAGGKVQSTIAGRIEAHGGALPALGQAVKKGQVLAHVLASTAPLERSNQAAQLAELRAAQALAVKRLARLRELSDTMPRKEIEAAESEVASLAGRSSAVSSGLGAREALVAPLTGVIAASNVVLGQVVDARELAFEIVDPTKLGVEATTYDPALPANIASASMAVGSETVQLQFNGAARTLRDQALPLNFRAQGAALSSLAVGQPVKVFVHTRAVVSGFSLPSSAVMRNTSNQNIVWVKTDPERFEPRIVTLEPLDGVNVAITQGLKAGDRVATQGATLINQVR
ncbi:MAG: efflux RND transporter periplasmic adaptor subunit [Xanthomonadaceae bacterium]|nr:efflux RND transporter periplasmic adaptor subunit [Xanthomonadaceae bacterium]